MISRKLPISIDIKRFREAQEFGAGVLYQILTGSFCELIRLPAAEERVLKMGKNHIAALLIVTIIAYPMLAHTQYWGEERYAHSATNIRDDRTTESIIIGQLIPGQKIRTDFLENNWFAIFSLEETVRDERKALGYVYAPLLTPDRPASKKPSVKSSSMLNYKVVLKEEKGHPSLEVI